MRGMLGRVVSVVLAPIAALLVWGALGAPAVAADVAVPAPCRIAGLKHEVLCGHVSRPLDPNRPEGRQIEVHYVVVPATASRKRDDPVFFFAGGPGQSAISLAGPVLSLLQRLGNRRDLVLIDQRGTGRSAPLECESDEAQPLARRFDVAAATQRLNACLAHLKTLPHGDLRQYTTTIAMHDADAVRAALGAPQVNLVGASYGTRAVLEYLRLYPERVRRAVIDGVAPPDMALPDSQGEDAAAALARLFSDCEAETACRRHHPRLRANWQALWMGASVRATVMDPLGGRATEIAVSKDVLASAVRGPLYAPALAAALPFAIDEAAAGRFQPLIGLALTAGGGSRLARIAEGMHFSVVCAEDGPRMNAARGRGELGAVYARPYDSLCSAWPRGVVEPAFYQVPVAPVAVLAFSGGLDPVTPPRHAERVVTALGANARHVVLPNAGHGVMAVGCAHDVLHRFVDADTDAQALAVDASCLAAVPRPPAFELPGRQAAVLTGAVLGARP